MCEWSELLPEIIQKISVRIDNPFDLIHFRSVCSRWRCSSLPKFRRIPSLRCPRPPDDAGGYGDDDCHILRSRVFLINSLSHDPPRFWLFKLEEKENGVIALQRLFGKGTSSSEWGCSYPSLSLDLLESQVTELAQEHVTCYTIWCEWNDGGFPYQVAENFGYMQLDAEKKRFMILGNFFSKGLFMYRSFEQRWTEIETAACLDRQGITSFCGNFYAIDPAGVTVVVKPTLQVSSFQRSRPCDKTRKRWHVKSEDKLLLVEMCTNSQKEFEEPSILAEKGWFEVSELNKERNDWIQVEDLGGRVLFLHSDCSWSCLPYQVPGFRPNSIIFMPIYRSCGHHHQRFMVFEFGGL